MIRAACVLTLLVVGMLAPGSLSGQLKLDWPSGSIKPEEYVRIEQCLAGISRLTGRALVEQNKDIRLDTMPFHFDESILQEKSSEVRKFARECYGKWIANGIVIDKKWDMLGKVLLAADEQDSFNLLSQRKLNSVAITDSLHYTGVLDTIILTLHSSNPVDLDASDSLLRVRHLYPLRTGAIIRNHSQMGYARSIGRSDLAEAAARRIIELSEEIPEEDKAKREWPTIARIALNAHTYLDWFNYNELLSKSVDAYLDKVLDQREKVIGNHIDRFSDNRFAVGELVASISSDTVFRNPLSINATDSATTYPVVNQLNLIVFLGHECYRGVLVGIPSGKAKIDTCSRTASALKRLQANYPTLRIVVVSETHGYFSYLGPLEESQEAEWLRKWLQDHHGIPADVAVSYTPHFFLPAPDSRRIEEDLDHITEYSFGNVHRSTGRALVPSRSAFLISGDGRILYSSVLAGYNFRFSETELSNLVEAASHSLHSSSDMPMEGRARVERSKISDPVSNSVVNDFSNSVETLAVELGSNDSIRREIFGMIHKRILFPHLPFDTSDKSGQLDNFSEKAKEIVYDHFMVSDDSLSKVLRRMFLAYTYVLIEKKSGIHRANAFAASKAIKPSEDEYDVIRKNYDRLTAALSTLVTGEPKPNFQPPPFWMSL